MALQICRFCKEIFRCNGSCGAKTFQMKQCVCLKCYIEENKEKDIEWKKCWIVHDPCERKVYKE